jgi:copper chaperone CopZ
MIARVWISIIALLVVVTPVRVGAAAVDRVRLHVQVTGLFQPDRETDLRLLFETLPQFTLVDLDYDRAEMTVELNPAEVWPKEKPEGYIKRLDDEIGKASRRTFGVQELRTIPLEKLQRVEIPIEGLDCKGCSYAAYQRVFELPGIDHATVSFKSGKLVAFIDPDAIDAAKIAEALKKGGVSVVTPKK